MAETVEGTGDIEVNDELTFNDNDSAYYDDDAESSTRSVASSIYEYENAHGRTYHAYHAGKYILPNDPDEQERCDVMYHAIRLSVGNKLFFAPVEKMENVLDVGTGTGLWAMDMADAHPSAQIIGTDLSPIQPTYIPPNLEFQIADADEEWTFRQEFDLVHTRIMNDTSLKDWPRFYREAFRCLKPGGWVESQEFSYKRCSDDGTLVPDSRVAYWEDKWTEGINKIGLQGVADPDLISRQMSEAGFINVNRLSFKMPIGPWPKDPRLRAAGLYGLVNLLDGFHGLSVKIFTQILGWHIEDLEMLLAECRQELRRKDVHAYMPIWVITGQKPRE